MKFSLIVLRKPILFLSDISCLSVSLKTRVLLDDNEMLQDVFSTDLSKRKFEILYGFELNLAYTRTR